MDLSPPPSPHRPAYAALIALHRRRLGLTQRALARRVGVATHRVEAWELGRYAPRAARVRRLATALGLEVDTLLAAIEPPPE